MRALRIPEDQLGKVEGFLGSLGFKKRDVKNTLWSYEGEGAYFNMYPSGTLLVQGKAADRWAGEILSLIDVPEGPIAGCDEVGKGDVFGPLVLCCAVIPPENFKKVLSLNPKDSKALKDEEVIRKAEELRKLVKVRCITLMPERFNDLYKEYGNINRLMDAAYLRILETVLEDFKPYRVVVDRYSSRNPFQGIKNVEFLEKGERDVAVSVASILAREKFLRKLKELEKTYDVRIPKGASGDAKHEAKKIADRNPDLARRLLKLSFLE